MPASVGDCLRRARRQLRESSASADLDAELLLAHSLGVSRAYLYTHPERALEPAERAAFEALLERRREGRPIAQILGSREFWSLDLFVSGAVLTPRADTETLVETALQSVPDRPAEVLDLGTGSGAIAIALATERPRWQLTATDISAAALAVAARNITRHRLGQRIDLVQGDWWQACGTRRFDLIVSNPPYIRNDDPHLRDSDLEHEPRTALVAGADGLAAIRAILAAAAAHLKIDGWLWFEHGWDQSAAVRELLAAAGFGAIRTQVDLAGRDRVSGGQRSRPAENHA